MSYIKDNGDFTKRQVIVISEPRENYLVLDVSKLTSTESNLLEALLCDVDEVRDATIADFETITGKQYNSLWRSFKPGGIEWDTEDEI